MRNLATLLVVFLLVLTACGQDAAGDQFDAQAASLTATAAQAAGTPLEDPPDEVPEGCRLVTVVDNYGFETEVLECGPDGESLPDADTVDDPIAWLGSANALTVSAQLRNGLVLHSGCADGEWPAAHSWDLAAASAALIGAPSEFGVPLAAALRELASAQTSCETNFARWSRHLEAAIAHLADFAAAVEELRS